MIATILFLGIPLTIGYCKIGEKLIAPIIEGVVLGTMDAIEEVKKNIQVNKENK